MPPAPKLVRVRCPAYLRFLRAYFVGCELCAYEGRGWSFCGRGREVHHILARGRGGGDAVGNLLVLGAASRIGKDGQRGCHALVSDGIISTVRVVAALEDRLDTWDRDGTLARLYEQFPELAQVQWARKAEGGE